MRGLLMTLSMAMMVMASPVAASAGDAVAEMATIIINLNHYPTETEKKELAAIVADSNSTAGEKLIAGALMRMQHRVGGDDAQKLMQLESDKKASKEERELAGILRGIAHHPTDADVKRLKALSE